MGYCGCGLVVVVVYGCLLWCFEMGILFMMEGKCIVWGCFYVGDLV